MVRAYQNNPQLNAQRAQVRSTDENVPQALSGYRPKVAITASAGYQYTDTNSRRRAATPNVIVRTEIHGTNAPAASAPRCRKRSSTASRPRTGRGRRRARSPSAREGLRVLEQTVLLVGGYYLYGLSARRRHRRGSAQQRSRSRTNAEADPGSLQRR